MMTKFVVKRDGSYQAFNGEKIKNAMRGAFSEVYPEGFDTSILDKLNQNVVFEIEKMGKPSIGIEEIQDLVEDALMEEKETLKVAKAYIRYRENHREKRDMLKDLMKEAESICGETDKMNANIVNSPSAKMLQMGALMSKAFANYAVYPAEFMNAHKNGDIHIHDLDFSLFTVNCLQIPAKRLFSEGFNCGQGFIRPPKHIGSACALMAILIQSSQNDMFGGQSVPSFDEVMAPYCGEDVPDSEIYQAMQGLVYNLNSMHARAGAQVPFSSLNVGLNMSYGGRRATKQLLLAYEDGLGKGENPIFPNILFKVKRGVNRDKGDMNYDLFKLAMKVAARRMNPTFVFMDTTFNSPYKSVDYMGCRTRVVSNINGEETSEARGNLFFVTMNLPRLGIMADHNVEKFFELLDEKMDLCQRQLLHRYNYVKNLKVKDLPFVMGQHLYMGSENLDPEDSIEPAIRQGTMAVGFIGLAETLKALIGKHHGESEEALELGLKIVSHMKEMMDKIQKKTHLNFSLFATPAEGLSGRFTKMDKKLFGEIEGVTDREFYTNSCHVPVYYKLTHFKKMATEGKFHKYCLGGHIAYVEFDAPPINNLFAVEKELNHMADSDIGYAGLNFPIDYCEDCGYQGVIAEESCPICGEKHIRRIRRVTGYLSELNNFNSAKHAEAMARTTEQS